jgi:hypothetical protein
MPLFALILFEAVEAMVLHLSAVMGSIGILAEQWQLLFPASIHETDY